MKNFMKNIQSKFQHTVVSAQNAIATKKAEGYVDSGVKILIAVVIGALLLAGLYTLFNTNIMPAVSDKIASLFGYAGEIE